MQAKWSLWIWVISVLGIGSLAYLIETQPDTIEGRVKQVLYRRIVGVLMLIFGAFGGYFVAKNTNWENTK